MGSYPTSPRSAFLAWCQAHTIPWGSNAAGIGLTAPIALEFTTLTTALATSMDAVETARLAYRNAVNNCNDAYRDLRAAAGNNVRSIRGYAEQQPKPQEIYDLAQIDPPAPPSPMPAPGQCTNLRVELLANGALGLRWKSANPAGASGTAYEIFRRIGTSGAFGYIGVAGGDKSYTDDTVPAGSTSVTYEITGIRSGIRGLPAQFLVNFGVGGGGFTVMSITEGAKLAA
jgi:hypothetical protein